MRCGKGKRKREGWGREQNALDLGLLCLHREGEEMGKMEQEEEGRTRDRVEGGRGERRKE